MATEKKLLMLLGILLISHAIKASRGEDKNPFDPEDVEYFKEIGQQIAKFMCRHFDEVLTSLNVTKDDLW